MVHHTRQETPYDIVEGLVMSAFGKTTIKGTDFPGAELNFSRTYFNSDRKRSKYAITPKVQSKLLSLISLSLSGMDQELTKAHLNRMIASSPNVMHQATLDEAIAQLQHAGQYWQWQNTIVSTGICSFLSEIFNLSIEFLVIQPDDEQPQIEMKKSNTTKLVDILLSSISNKKEVDLTEARIQAAEYTLSIATYYKTADSSSTALLASQYDSSLMKENAFFEKCLNEVDALFNGRELSESVSGRLVRKLIESIGISNPKVLATITSPNYAKVESTLLSASLIGNSINGLDVISRAVDEIDENAQIENLDPDWIVDFYDKAGKARGEDVKYMFSRILSTEARMPGTVSKRLLWTLSVLGRRQAKEFLNLCRFCFYDMDSKDAVHPIIYMTYAPGSYNNAGLDTAALARLRNLGLIDVDYDRGYGVNKAITLRYESKIYSIKKKEEAPGVPLGNVRLTLDGRALFDIVEKSSSSGIPEFVVAVLQNHNCLVRCEQMALHPIKG